MSNEDVTRGEAIAASGKYNGTAVDDPWTYETVHHEQPDGEHQDDQIPADPDDSDQDYFVTSEYEIQERLHRLRIQHEARTRLDQEIRPDVTLPPIKPLAELLAEPDTPVNYRIDKLALDGARIMLSAQYKAGKTTAVNNLIRSLADNTPFLGRFDVKIPAKRIVLIDDELDDNTLRRWLREQEIVNTAAIADVVRLRGRLTSLNLLDDRCRERWTRRLADLGCDYLILDCLRPILDALGLDENRDAGKFLVPFDAMLDSAGITNALVVQHMGHTGERSRGDSRLQDWPDAIWRLVRESEEPDSGRFFSAFGRDVNVAEGRLSFDNRRLIYTAGNRDEAKVEAAVVAVLTLLSGDAVHGGDGLSGSAIERDLGGDHTQKSIRAALRKLVNRGRVEVVDGPRRSRLHSIAKPCARCGMPMLTDEPQHRSCAEIDVEGLLT